MKFNSLMCVKWIAVTLVICLFAGWVSARDAEIITKDGRKLSGQVQSESTQMVTILIAGIPTSITRDDIESITFSESVDELYKQKRAELANDDLDGRYNLARWLYEKNALPLAKTELDSLAEQFPDDTRVTAMRNIVINRLKMDNKSGQKTKPETNGKTSKPASGNLKIRELAEMQLNEEQINLVKVYELDTDLSGVKIVIPKPVINEFLENYGEHDAAPKGTTDIRRFKAAKGSEQLDIFFAARARDLYSQVQIRQDPRSISEFRKYVHPRLVVKYCASCHSTTEDNSMYLFNINPVSDKTVYTNFHILTSYSNDSGLMLDREAPERSLMLEYSLPRSYATTPHPKVPGWEAHFLSPEDSNYQKIVEWIGGLYRPAPDYGFEYTPPYTRPAPVGAEPGAEDAVNPE